MPSDITRTSDDRRQGYQAPVLQQGRVILDRDFNALQETLAGELHADALDIIGPCGTPDDGFAISVQVSSPPAPPLWIPPAPLGAPGLHPFDFFISPGTMYVGGERAVFPAAGPGQHPFTYSYFDQPDWIHPADFSLGSPPASPQVEFIYLQLFEQEVSAVEDPDLKDVALGGPDTTQRLRLMRRVKRLPTSPGDCASALEQARAVWLKHGFQFDPATMRLLPQVALQVGFSQAATAADPCDPVATGGYLGADNQLIRVQISDAGDGTPGSARLLWSYDNASFIYRVIINPDGKTLQLNQSPVDAFHSPKSGQVVEVLHTAAVLESDPDTSDPFHTKTIVRCVAESRGEVRTLATGYDPATGTVVLNQALPNDYLGQVTPIFLRIWQAELSFDPSGETVELADTAGVTTGVQVTITVPKNGALPLGAYWMIAVRPSTPQAVYPERFLLSPQPPDGPREWACPLAVIDWTKADTGSPPGGRIAIQDCRDKFDNLVTLTKRKLGGCCTVQVRPGDLTGKKSLQDIIDQFASPDRTARQVTVCLMPGKYELKAPLLLDHAHSNFTIEGCHDGAVIEAAPGFEAAFLDGLFVLLHADNVVLRNLRFHLPLVPVGAAGGQIARVPRKLLATSKLQEVGAFTASVGVRALHCACLEVHGCLFRFALGVDAVAEQPPVSHSPLFAVGLFAGSECWGFKVDSCRFLHDDDSKPVRPSDTGAAAPAPPVLIGLAIMPQVVFGDSLSAAKLFTSGQVLSALVEEGVFRDNTFSGLSFAIMAVADMGLMRLERNIVRLCQNGFFLVSPETNAAFPLLPFVVPTGQSASTSKNPNAAWVETLGVVAENPLFQRARVLAASYPIPGKFNLSRAAKVEATEGEDRTVAILEELHNVLQPPASGSKTDAAASHEKRAAKSAKADETVVVTKDIAREISASVRRMFKVGAKSPPLAVADALLGRLGRAALSQPGQPRLTLRLQVSGNEVAVYLSALILGDFKLADPQGQNPAITHTGPSIFSGNHMQTTTHPDGSTTGAVPTVYLLAMDQCTVTGNIIGNQTLRGLSLLLLPIATLVNGDALPPVAVSGNVLQGLSNLSTLRTGKPAPVDTWDYANTTVL